MNNPKRMKTIAEINLLIDKEREQLTMVKNVCENAIKIHIKKHNLENKITGSERRVLELATRVFDGEIEFLNSNPIEYYEIYLEDMEDE